MISGSLKDEATVDIPWNLQTSSKESHRKHLTFMPLSASMEVRGGLHPTSGEQGRAFHLWAALSSPK